MPILKYWDGAAWQALASAGGTPSIKSMPAKDQPGSIYETAMAGYSDINGTTSVSVYSVPPSPIAPFPSYANQRVLIVGFMYAGAGGSDMGIYHEIVRSRDQVRMAGSGYPCFTHGGYFSPILVTTTIDAAAGGESNSSGQLVHFVTGTPNIHTGGGVAWMEIAT